MIDYANDYYFDEEAADHAVDFFEECLCHTKGRLAGQPFRLEPWQDKIVRDIFGWKRTKDGTRRYRQAYVEIPRKNGKTTLGAGIALYLLREEEGGEVYSCAKTRDQASICFNIAAAMVRKSDFLSKLFTVRASTKRIMYKRKDAFYKAISSDADSAHGYNPSGVIFDELHTQPNRELWDAMETGTGARDQPLTWTITTAGFDRQSICWERHEWARRVANGEVQDPECYPAIFSAEESDDWTSPKTWHKANPCLGVSVQEDFLAAQCLKAKESPAYENTFRRLYLNQWTEQDVRWMPMNEWRSCDGVIEESQLLGRTCGVGIDIASRRDLSAVVLCFRLDDGTYHLIPRFWAPRDSATLRQRQDKAHYLGFAQNKLIDMTPGNVTDYKQIQRYLVEVGQKYDIGMVYYDDYNMDLFIEEMETDHGWKVEKMCRAFKQSAVMYNSPMKHLLELVLKRKVSYNQNEVLTWNFANIVVKPDSNGNIKPDKGASGDKIDGACAAIMALDAVDSIESHSGGLMLI